MYAVRYDSNDFGTRPMIGLALRQFTAPRMLTNDHQLEFRRRILEALEISASSGAKQVELNLGSVIEIDASGLNILILAQKRARERGMRLRLVDVPRAMGALLAAARPEPLFDIVRSR